MTIPDYFSDVEFISLRRETKIRRIRPNGRRTISVYSLEFLARGEILFLFGDHEYHLCAPCAFWMRPGDRFDYEPIPGRPVLEHLWINMRGGRARRMLESLNGVSRLPYRKISAPERFYKLFSESVIDFLSDPVANHCAIAARIETIMALLAAEFASKPQSRRTADKEIRAVAIRIHDDPAANWVPRRIAADLGIGYDSLRARFRKAVGQPIYNFILQQRLRLAAEMLSENLLVKEIAAHCGFASGFELSRAFTRHFGLSPRQYRRRNYLENNGE